LALSSIEIGIESNTSDLRQHPARGPEADQRAADAIGAASDTAGRKHRSVESDDDLIGRIRAGDRAAFDLLYKRYFKRVYGFLDRRLQNRADTEETTQEVFINVFSSIDSFRGEAPFAAWIFGLTRRTLAARFKRKRHPTVPLPETDDDFAGTARSADGSTHTAPDATPLEHYEMLERAALLRHALEHDLSPEQRKVFELHHLESISIAEIARSLSKSEDSVKSNLYRTRKILLAR
jgi:RNA polymerase sigma-70 factor (ECF subfamily)